MGTDLLLHIPETKQNNQKAKQNIPHTYKRKRGGGADREEAGKRE